jgi:acyl-coenzyme A thioesterase PaaI-like protein
VASDAIQFRSTASEPGETHVELEMTPKCLGDDGTIRRGVVLQLIEAAATAGASHLSGASPRLLSLSTAFLKPLGSDDLAAVASAHDNEGTVHVSVEVHAVSDSARPIATAQAVYATGTSPDVRGSTSES